MPARCTRRVPCSMKNSTYRRRRNTVSTWKKSAARIVFACASRNARQVCPDRLGAGSMPASLRIRQTVDGAVLYPRPVSSPWIAPVPPGGVVPRHLKHQRTDGRGGAGPPGSAAWIGPVPPHQARVPAQQRPGRDDQAQVAELAAGQQPGQRGQDRAVSPGQLRGLTWRWSTATWWRKIRISASLARPDRASKASQPNTRSTAR